MDRIFMALALLWFGFSSASAGDVIYQWVDEKGVKHFSDVAPEGNRKVTVVPGQGQSRPDPESDKQRKSFDSLVEQLNKETAASEAERKRRLEAEERQHQREAEAKRREQLEKKRKAILKEIEMIEKRALSPTFTEGMRKARLEKLKKQLQELK